MQDVVDLLAPGAPASVPLAERLGVADGYLEQLAAWLAERAAPEDLAGNALVDVRSRLHALARRWTSGSVLPLFGAYLEVAQWNEPRELNLLYRAAATVGVRNSALEDLHVCDPSVVEQEDWCELTVDAARLLARWGGMRGRDEEYPSVDPFSGLAERYPVAWETFGQMLLRDPKGVATFEVPAHEPMPVPQADVETELSADGLTVLPAMDARIDRRLSDVLRQCVAGELDAFVTPSLKHISRNPQRLFHVVEVLLTNDCLIATANLQLRPGRVTWRGQAAGYNEWDDSWLPDHVMRQVGRNDPCPCGSGKKFKRCHGA